jgi:hypothetical protein
MSSCDWSPLNPRQIREWIAQHPDALPHSLNELSRFPMAFRRIMVNMIAPEVRNRLWRQTRP